MKQLTLEVNKRGVGKKGRRELDPTLIPGVVYGREFKSTPVAADLIKLNRLFHEAGYNHVISLDLEGSKQDTVFKEVQLDPLTSQIRHFDLYAIVRGEKIKAEVPVLAVGNSPAVATGAHLAVYLETVEVECVPSKLPDHLELDISVLEEIGDSLSVKDIKTDDDVTILEDSENLVFKAEEIKEMVIEEPEEEVEAEEGEEGEEGEGETGEESAEEEESAEADKTEEQ